MVWITLAYMVLSIVATGVAENKTSLKFFALGDWGGLPFWPYRTFVEEAIAREMGEMAMKDAVDFVIALGDNFYTKGVANAGDPRFKETYEDVFKAPSLQIPWFVVGGNHDHYGNISAQIEYSKSSNRWHFPDFYYKKLLPIPSSNATLELLMIDTVLLCGNTAPTGPPGQPLQNTCNESLASMQLQWIEQNLNESRADYLLVCGHFPVYSIAEHGSTKCLIEKLLPLLNKYKVSAYISGHDHNIQHIRPKSEEWTVEYFVSGCSNSIENSYKHVNSIPPCSLQYFWADIFSLGGFSMIEAAPSNLTVSFYEADGTLLYSHSFGPRPH